VPRWNNYREKAQLTQNESGVKPPHSKTPFSLPLGPPLPVHSFAVSLNPLSKADPKPDSCCAPLPCPALLFLGVAAGSRSRREFVATAHADGNRGLRAGSQDGAAVGDNYWQQPVAVLQPLEVASGWPTAGAWLFVPIDPESNPMPAAHEEVRNVRVFVSSPSDVAEERAVLDELVASINRTDGEAAGFRLELIKWETHVTPQIGPRPQQVVDAQIPDYDVYVGILKHRFGTPTGRYGSGTEKEFRDALKRWKAEGSPWILFYFSKAQIDPDEFDLDQYAQVKKFRQQIDSKGQGLYCVYAGVRGNADSFYEKVGEHLRKVIRQIVPPDKPARDPNARDTSSSKTVVPPQYLEWLSARCGEVELIGVDLTHGSGVRLNHVYTPLTTNAALEFTIHRAVPTRDTTEEDLTTPESQRESRRLLLSLLDQDSLYVHGGPGTGKTTFARWVAYLACNSVLPPVDVPAPDEYREVDPESLRGRLPVLIRLRDFWQCLPPAGVQSVGQAELEQALSDWVDGQRSPGLDGALVLAHLARGSALLMLDGVDEVPPIHQDGGRLWYPREMLLAGLSEAIARWTRAGNRLLVTSRPYGLDSHQQGRLGLPVAAILGLDPPLQALLVRRWFVRLKEGTDLGLETAAAMIDHLHVERGLDDLADNPLLLTAMCIIFDQGKRLPHDKYLLYDKIVDTVLQRRYPAKERVGPIRGRLAAVALGMHTGDGLGQRRAAPEASASQGELDLLLQAYQQLDGKTDRGLTDIVLAREDLLSQSGLLVSNHDGRAAFYHLSIQEFLAAERLFLVSGYQRDGFIATLRDRGSQPGWRNTLSFLFGCLVSKFSEHRGIEWLRPVFDSLELPPVDPSRRQQLDPVWNLAIVLGDCLQILPGRSAAIPDDVRSAFVQCVKRAIEQEIAVAARHTLAVALGHLGDPRIVLDLRVSGSVEQHGGYVQYPGGHLLLRRRERALQRRPAVLAVALSRDQFPVRPVHRRRRLPARGTVESEGWTWVQEDKVTSPDYWRDPKYNAPNQPVVGVSWWEADAFCRWAGLRSARRARVGRRRTRSRGQGLSLGQRLGRKPSATPKAFSASPRPSASSRGRDPRSAWKTWPATSGSGAATRQRLCGKPAAGCSAAAAGRMAPALPVGGPLRDEPALRRGILGFRVSPVPPG
jgi:hypothetical protein